MPRGAEGMSLAGMLGSIDRRQTVALPQSHKGSLLQESLATTHSALEDGWTVLLG
jgi:hypothetical protein